MLHRVDDFDWLVVTSQHGAQRVGRGGAAPRTSGSAAVGTKTADELAALAKRPVDVVPDGCRPAPACWRRCPTPATAPGCCSRRPIGPGTELASGLRRARLRRHVGRRLPHAAAPPDGVRAARRARRPTPSRSPAARPCRAGSTRSGYRTPRCVVAIGPSTAAFAERIRAQDQRTSLPITVCPAWLPRSSALSPPRRKLARGTHPHLGRHDDAPDHHTDTSPGPGTLPGHRRRARCGGARGGRHARVGRCQRSVRSWRRTPRRPGHGGGRRRPGGRCRQRRRSRPTVGGSCSAPPSATGGRRCAPTASRTRRSSCRRCHPACATATPSTRACPPTAASWWRSPRSRSTCSATTTATSAGTSTGSCCPSAAAR